MTKWRIINLLSENHDDNLLMSNVKFIEKYFSNNKSVLLWNKRLLRATSVDTSSLTPLSRTLWLSRVIPAWCRADSRVCSSCCNSLAWLAWITITIWKRECFSRSSRPLSIRDGSTTGSRVWILSVRMCSTDSSSQTRFLSLSLPSTSGSPPLRMTSSISSCELRYPSVSCRRLFEKEACW